MTIYAPTWCPEDPAHPERPIAPCDPCQCYAEQTVDFQTYWSPTYNRFDLDFGNLAFCRKHFVWPFVLRSTLTPDFKQTGYGPLGVYRPGVDSTGGYWHDNVEILNLSYLGNVIFSTTITHHYVGGNPGVTGGASWDQEIITCNPAPETSFRIKYDYAASIAAQAGLSISQYYGDYTQADPINNPTGPIMLKGVVYDGPLNELVDQVLSATVTATAGLLGQAYFKAYGLGAYGTTQLYYCPQPVTARVRRRMRLVGQRI